MKTKKKQAVVDRISGSQATLSFSNGRKEVILPKEWLPKGTSEGTWLEIEISLNSDLTEKMREENQKLLDKIIGKNK